jgi:signal transduction histidine kinase
MIILKIIPGTDPDFLKIIIIAILIILLFLSFIVVFFYIFQKRAQENSSKVQELKSTFQQEMLKAQNEIQEQTLTHISRELHDNVTQVLSFVKLNLAMTGNLSADEKEEKVSESRKLVAQAISDLRDLSKSLSFEHISQLGLGKTIEIEVERISKSGLIDIYSMVQGEPYPMGEQRELVLFRIFQEAINNSLKHSNATHLYISLEYSEQFFNLTIEDDGDGFLPNLPESGGSGLKNIKNRAALIGAVAVIDSEPGKGCCVKVTIDPLLQHIYANGTYQNSSG